MPSSDNHQLESVKYNDAWSPDDKKELRSYASHHPWRFGTDLPGKGIVTATGNVISWEVTPGAYDNDRYPYHGVMVRALGYGDEMSPDTRWMFRVDPDGRIQAYGSAKPTGGLATRDDIKNDPYFGTMMRKLGLPTDKRRLKVSTKSNRSWSW